ncbi:RDD family protein [Bermanella marisrubri]|uniref:RDD domain-containing protein n=1 Tax=Bermanella marisrubri TaxID=207949 RepID=Q1N5S0_9GAMM|nr:RDD family protein [Bermanella marisrubri]EAT13872.1 hypothetical protein RED65_10779 [Oceanobacter sp. RED65] [Bermanella marisrubri]QIZ84632.1 RDD family protein [Bermanella marisrubri]
MVSKQSIPETKSFEITKSSDPLLRLINLIVDTFMLLIVCNLFVFIAGFIFGHYSIDLTTSFAIATLTYLSYYIILESIFGKTLGKIITKTKVVDEYGGLPSLPQVIARTFSRLIPFEPFSFARDDSRGWHDSIPGTYVILDK